MMAVLGFIEAECKGWNPANIFLLGNVYGKQGDKFDVQELVSGFGRLREMIHSGALTGDVLESI